MLMAVNVVSLVLHVVNNGDESNTVLEFGWIVACDLSWSCSRLAFAWPKHNPTVWLLHGNQAKNTLPAEISIVSTTETIAIQK